MQGKIIHDIEQGTEEWLELRKNHLCASDASAMMDVSPFKSRNQLLHEMKTGEVPEASPGQQKIYAKGHEVEKKARILLEFDQLEDFPPVVFSQNIEGLCFLASLDGYCNDIIFEHKLWNKTLAENVKNKTLDPAYYYQLEHQLLTANAKKVIFVTSDGTTDNWEQMTYTSIPERREGLILGWKQFIEDLKNYQPKAKKEPVYGIIEDFPSYSVEVSGSIIVSNLPDILPIIEKRAQEEIGKDLETDQDFANKEQLNKTTREVRKKLKEIVSNIEKEFTSFAEFKSVAMKIDSVLQKMQSHGEKQVKEAKERKKRNIADAATAELNNYLQKCDAKMAPMQLCKIIDIAPDWYGAMRGKRNIESLQNAIDAELAKAKIDINAAMERILPNISYTKKHAKGYEFLFSDITRLLNNEVEAFEALINERIAKHKKLEKERIEAELTRTKEEKAEKQKEQNHVVDDNEKVKPKNINHFPDAKKMVTTGAEIQNIKKNETFALELSYWADNYNVCHGALVALKKILRQHNVEI